MIRSIAVLVSAILLSRPGMPRLEARHYAKVLNDVAREHDFDPLAAVAIVHFETQWRPALISPDGEDYGLGQVRARFASACRGDDDPLNAPSEACKAAKAMLLDGATNLRRMGNIIEANRDLCREKTGTAKLSQWLAGYQGLNFPDRNRWCQPGAKTWRVIGYYDELVAKLAPKPKPKPAPKTKPAKPKAAPIAKREVQKATPAPRRR